MEYMEVSLDSLDLRVKGILSSPAGGERGPGPGLCSAGAAGAVRGGPAAPWRLRGPARPHSARHCPDPGRWGWGWGSQLGESAVAREGVQGAVTGLPSHPDGPICSMKDAGLACPQGSPGAFCSAPLKRRDLGALGHWVLTPGCCAQS